MPVPFKEAKRTGSMAVMVLRLLANVKLKVAAKSPASFTRFRFKLISYPLFCMSPPFSTSKTGKPVVVGIATSFNIKSVTFWV